MVYTQGENLGISMTSWILVSNKRKEVSLDKFFMPCIYLTLIIARVVRD